MVYEETRVSLTRNAAKKAGNVRDKVMAEAKARNDLEKEQAAAKARQRDLQEAHNRTESTNSRGEASTAADAKSSRVPGDEAANTATGSDAKATTGEHLSAVEEYNYEFRDSDSEEEDLIPVPHFQKLFGLSPSNPFEDKKEIHFLQDLNNHDQANTLHSRGRYTDTMSIQYSLKTKRNSNQKVLS